ncbi:MAG: GtrA family protein [Clostridia bacterium]|nr:GtrA family protein [Clostridia bacterium]
MKNFLYLLFHFKLKELFVDDTNDGFIQFFRFCFVGGAATIVDMAVGVIFRNILPFDFILNLGLFTLSLDAVSSAFGFIAGLVTNYLLSISWVFKRKDINRVKEFIIFAIIGIIGLFINTGVMEILGKIIVKANDILFIAKKVIATLVTMIWNFAGRKLILYRNSGEKE